MDMVKSIPPAVEISATIARSTPAPALVRSAMGGFFLLGCLMALLGALLPVWAYYVPFDLQTAGVYFLSANFGALAAIASRRILNRMSLRLLLATACFLAAGMLLVSAAILTPALLVLPLLALGFAAGMLIAGLSSMTFEAVTAPMSGVLLSLARVFIGAGAVCFTLLVWTTVHVLTLPGILMVSSLLPLALGGVYLRQKAMGPMAPASGAAPPRLSVYRKASPLAVMLSVALLVQHGNEWAVSGWLAMYLVRRLGVTSETALLALALFWAILAGGKVLLPRMPWMSHRFRMISASTAACLFGCLLLLSTAGAGGAIAGVLCLSAGMSVAYSLIAGMLAEHFPGDRGSFFSSLFSISLIGGMLEPWLVGQMAGAWVIGWAIRVPAAGVLVVYLLVSALLLEMRVAKVSKTASSS